MLATRPCILGVFQHYFVEALIIISSMLSIQWTLLVKGIKCANIKHRDYFTYIERKLCFANMSYLTVYSNFSIKHDSYQRSTLDQLQLNEDTFQYIDPMMNITTRICLSNHK